MISIYIFLFIIGSILGSFYTVVGMRRPLNESIVKPRSHCDNCKHVLKWYELIPIVSYIIQTGRCKSCNSKIPYIYPLIEFLTGTLFVVSFHIYGFSYNTLIMFVISSLLIIIYVSDFTYYIILDGPLIICGILLVIIKFLFVGHMEAIYSIIAGIGLFLVMLSIKFIGDKVFKRESLGGGDIKLAIIIGLVLGFKLSIVSLIVASFIALPYAAILLLRKKEDEMPFGPFLISSVLIVFMFMDYFNRILDLIYYI